jgi:hypothetical protein
VRRPTFVLAALIVLTAPLAAEAQRHHTMGGGRIYIPPPKLHPIKPQTITPKNAALAAAQEKSFNKLKADLEALKPKATATKEQKAELQKDLLAVVDGSNKPASAAVQKLSADLADVLAKRTGPTGLDSDQLAHDLKTVMNSAYAIPVDVSKAIKDGQATLKSSGLSETDAQLVAKDLKAISSAATAAGQPGMIR